MYPEIVDYRFGVIQFSIGDLDGVGGCVGIVCSGLGCGWGGLLLVERGEQRLWLVVENCHSS